MKAQIDQDVVSWIESNVPDVGMFATSSFAGGSSWSSAYVFNFSSGQKFFVKTARGRTVSEMFEGEALGLRAMHDTNTIRIPKVFHYGAMGASSSFIVMEYLNIGGRPDPAELGRRLALMHLAEPNDPNAKAGKFGFVVNNTIGGTPQPNSWCDDWVEFFRERRLRHQLSLANDANLSRMGEILCSGLDRFFEDIEDTIKPSVLHGDLWSGNVACVDGKDPCIFDPATYYGHHEAEFGMSWCAGFGGEFWRAYFELIPKSNGWEDRHDLYQLYHYLNHYNLFGSGYYNECARILDRLTKKLK